ncbi:MAG: ferredoxin-NADP reductase [Rhodocyclaceae bacterium]|nr:MAG: ferredoxin-NADP reductase [Rhodocyclaceae bacterium]
MSHIRVAVVGAGPAGIYVADALMRKLPQVQVDLIDQLPTPLGLLRGGVAPDHQATKSIARQFERVLGKEGVRFLGNVAIGRDASYAELKSIYDVVVITIGAMIDRRMDIPGEDLPGVYGSGAFVAWYNGLPAARDLDPLLDVGSVAIVGNGNVALDIARLLGKTEGELASSDLCGHARAKLADASLSDIWLIGRRGPLDAGFSPAELGEMGELSRVAIMVDGTQLPAQVPDSLPEERRRIVEKNLALLHGFAARSEPRPIRLHFLFYAAPLAVLGEGRARRLILERTRVDNGRALMTGETFEISVDTVITAIGYRSRPFPGLPFDDRQGIVINQEGRVEPGVYAAGWCKRGPKGVIPANRTDSLAVAELIIQDVATGSGSGKPGGMELDRLLAQRDARVVDFAGWQKINAAEVARGAAQQRPREKFTRIEELLAAAVS